MNRILIIGATSAIARAAASIWAERGESLYLLGRDTGRLEAMAADLKIHGALFVGWASVDFGDYKQHQPAITQAVAAMQGLDVVLIAHGALPDQKRCEQDFFLLEESMATNFTTYVSWLTHLANFLEKQRHGCIGVITSVAGDRGRQSNYIYGAFKAGVSVFVDGMRGRLASSGVSLTNIKPGFVDTPMTAHLPKGPLFASASRVGRGIVTALDRRRNTVYLPWFWWSVMRVIRAIPECVFKRLKL